MRFVPTPLAGAVVIELDKREDERGFFARVFCEREFTDAGLDTRFVQINNSLTPIKSIAHSIKRMISRIPDVPRAAEIQDGLNLIETRSGALGRFLRQYAQLAKLPKPQERPIRILPLAQELRMGVIINRPFGSGGVIRAVLGKPLPPWAAEFDCDSWAQFFLKWILADPAVTCAIPGTSRPQHLADNLKAAMGKLPDRAMRDRMAAHVGAG